MVSKERRAHWVEGIGQWLYYGVPIEDACDLPSAEELQKIVKALDERDRYRALLEEARRGYLKDGTIFAREVDAALEGKDQ